MNNQQLDVKYEITLDKMSYSHLLRSFQEDQLHHGDPLDPAEDKQDKAG